MTDVKVICRDSRHVNGKVVNLGLVRLAQRTPLSASDLLARFEEVLSMLRIEAQLLSQEFDELEGRQRAEAFVRRAEVTETRLSYLPRSSRLSRTGEGWRITERTGVWAEIEASGDRVWYLRCPACHRRACRLTETEMIAIVARHAESVAPLDISRLSN